MCEHKFTINNSYLFLSFNNFYNLTKKASKMSIYYNIGHADNRVIILYTKKKKIKQKLLKNKQIFKLLKTEDLYY